MASVNRPIRLSAEAQVNVSCSIGIVRWPGQDATVEELLHAADLAMYEAKNAGATSRTKASA